MNLVVPLEGDWAFAYQNELRRNDADGVPQLLPSDDFKVPMPVPGYWDDHLDRVRQTPGWRNAQFNPRAKPIEFPAGSGLGDAELPYLMGVGWYRRNVEVPVDWRGRTVTLHVGGAAQEAWVWVNGHYAGYHIGQNTWFELPLENHLQFGQSNDLVIAVANLRRDRDGCSIRGYAGQSGGITRPVSVRVGGALDIDSLYVYPHSGNGQLTWLVEVRGQGGELPGVWQCQWQVRDPQSGKTLGQGEASGEGGSAQWTTGTFGMQPWSDKAPRLYELQARVLCNGVQQAERTQSFGLRRLERDGMLLRLNGSPVYLRGATESHYFPLTCTASFSKDTYCANIRAMKKVGFNWLRFHTWTPNEEYLEAADELGMLVHVEPPYGAGFDEWMDILRACRRHPCVVIYCGGNEELLDEKCIERLRHQQQAQRHEVPDALFSPMEALRGVEYHGLESDMGDDPVPGPICADQIVNPRRLKLLQEFSDIFASLYYNMEYGWPPEHILWMNRADSTRGDWRSLGGLWRWFQDDHPHLLHELCILGTYLDLDLEHRYEGTRIGTDLYRATREHLRAEGVLDRASLYYRNSGALAAMWRKYHVELSRRSPQAQGYDILGAIDFHWHRTGYPCGMLNEFYELKAGETPENVMRYNAESVLLLDHTTNRNFYAGDEFNLELLVSHYGDAPIINGTVEWRLTDDADNALQRGNSKAPEVGQGSVISLGDIRFIMSSPESAGKVTLHVRLRDEVIELENQWDFWVFPKRKPAQVRATADEQTRAKLAVRYPELDSPEVPDAAPLRLVSELDGATVDYLTAGGRVVLFWQDSDPEVGHTLRPMSAGRPWGDCTTVVADHPLSRRFPHEGFCGWPFYSLLHHANPPVFNGLDLEFDPIVEVVSSYKRVRKQSLLFEYRVGKGRLLVCGFSLHWDDPATCWMLDELMAYAAGEEFLPRHDANVTDLRKLISRDTKNVSVFQNDNALDPNAQSATV